MNRQNTMLVGVLAIIVILGAGLMLGVLPQNRAAADARSAKTEVEQSNELLTLQLASLRKQKEDLSGLKEELGDLLFSCVNVARLCGEQPELLLKSATEKFIYRFEAMENLLKQDGKSLEGLTLAEMDVYWNAGKRDE